MKKIIFPILSFGIFTCTQAQNTYRLLENEMNGGLIHPSVIGGATDIDTSENVAFTISDNKKEYHIKSSAFDLIIAKSPFSISLLNNSTKSKWQLYQVLFDKNKTFNKALSVHYDNKNFTIKTDVPSVCFKIKIITQNMIRLSVINTDSTTKNTDLLFHGNGTFFGGGERFMGCALNGRSFSNNPNDHAWIPDTLRTTTALQEYEPTYLPVPFIYTPKGNGLYTDNADSTTINLQQADENNFSVSINNNKTDIYFFAADSPKQLLGSYTSLLGRTPLAPKWAFGVWLNLLKGADSVVYRANELRKLGIPSDVLWLFDFDDPESNTGWTLWTNGYYGNLRDITDTLHKLNFKVLTYLRSFVNRNLSYYNFPNPVYQYCKSNNFILPAKQIDENLFSNFHSNDQVNFYNENCIAWWKKVLQRNLVTENFDGWMEDFGDVSYIYDRKKLYYAPLQFSLDSPFSKLTNEQIADLYPLMYHRITHDLSIEIKPDMVSFSRSGSAGSAAYEPVIWGGDQDPSWDKNYGYPSAISAGLSAGLSGYSVWAPDILCLSPSRELWMRWVEFGAMTSIMRDHLWNYGKDNIRIWTDSSTLQFFKKYATLHEALKDYLYNSAKESTQTGIPVMRHLMLEYPNDTTTYHLEYEYLLGNDILVAPVVQEHAITEKVYLPEGKWKYYWSNQTYNGNLWITVDAPFSEIPFFIKQGVNTGLMLPEPE